MERRSEIRTVHLKPVLSERCNEQKALLEAVVRDTRQRPAEATWHHGSTVASFPDSRAFEKDPGEQQHHCALGLWHGKSHRRGAGLYWDLSDKSALGEKQQLSSSFQGGKRHFLSEKDWQVTANIRALRWKAESEQGALRSPTTTALIQSKFPPQSESFVQS